MEKNIYTKNAKKNIIICITAIFICFSCFCAGRLTGISSTSRELEQGVLLPRDTINRITDELNISGNSIKSADKLGEAILAGIAETKRSNELGRVCLNEVERAIKDNQEFVDYLRELDAEYFKSTEGAIDLAIKHAELYERIIFAYEQSNNNNSENANQPK